MTEEKLKTVAIIGRPNVGKSTLFNRLVGKRIAIETPIPGTTRDRLFGEVEWLGQKFDLIDVAGIETGSKKEIDKSMQEGVDIAINSADLILFVVDWTDKENDSDKIVARKLRQYKDKTILVVNKADNVERQATTEEFKRLGFESVIPVSSISGQNTGDLLDLILKGLAETATAPISIKQKPDINLAIIGRPNVGKSTLLNSMIGEKRAIVSEEAGTTRDVISVEFSHKGSLIAISDTAGLRRPGKIDKETIESFSVLRTYKALRESDVAILVIDANEGLVALDINILGKAKEWGKGIILAVNKIDLIGGNREEYMERMIWQLQGKLNFAPWLPIVFISAKDEENINHLLNQVVKAYIARKTVIEQEDLDLILKNAKELNFQLDNILSLTQKQTNPPAFEVKYLAKHKIHYTQLRYLENKIRDAFPMSGTPIYVDTVVLGKKTRK